MFVEQQNIAFYAKIGPFLLNPLAFLLFNPLLNLALI